MDRIETNYTETVDINRLSAGEYAIHIADVACHIQPLEEGLSEDLTGNFAKDFLMFCAVQDIKEGDRVVNGAVEYHVTAVDSYEFLRRDRHMEVKIRLSNK